MIHATLITRCFVMIPRSASIKLRTLHFYLSKRSFARRQYYSDHRRTQWFSPTHNWPIDSSHHIEKEDPGEIILDRRVQMTDWITPKTQSNFTKFEKILRTQGSRFRSKSYCLYLAEFEERYKTTENAWTLRIFMNPKFSPEELWQPRYSDCRVVQSDDGVEYD